MTHLLPPAHPHRSADCVPCLQPTDPASQRAHSVIEQAHGALASPWHLAVVSGPDAGCVLALPTGAHVRVGRGEVITDPCVSRSHLVLSVQEHGVRLQQVPGARTARWCLRPPSWLAGAGGLPLRRLHPGARWRPGRRVRIASTTLELRARPRQLIALTPTARRRPTLAVLSALTGLVMIAALVWTLRSGATHRFVPLGALVTVPLILMSVLRAVWAGGGRQHHAPRPPHASRLKVACGWRGRGRRTPDPASLLLLLIHAISRGPSHDPSTPTVSAWLGRRRRRHVLTVAPGETVVVRAPERSRGPDPGEPGTAPHAGARASLIWWAAQVAASSQAEIHLLSEGVTVCLPRPTTAPEESPQTEAHVLAGGTPSALAQAGRLVRAPTTPPAGPRWTQAVTQLLAHQEHPDPARSSSTTLSTAHQEQTLPQTWPLEEACGPADADLIAWQWSHAPTTGLPATLAVGCTGPIVVDLTRDGPHALVAGTTGAGKSELLTSWLLQLASARSPDHLSLILVDYKGGAAFGALESLPHTAGVLTDLEPDLTDRALTSLQAELRRRERLLAHWHASDVRDLPPARRPARVLIAVDEFAVLAASHPDVLDALIRVAAQGRSLGMHLILATQRPHGAVSPEVRANTAVRVCLRVLDQADSYDVLGHGGSAHLSSVPGRLMVCGPPDLDRIVGQAPWAGGSAQVTAWVETLTQAYQALGRPPASSPSEGRQDHQAGDAPAGTCTPDGTRSTSAWRPWAPPLPRRVRPSQVTALPAATTTPSLPANAPPPGQNSNHEPSVTSAPASVTGNRSGILASVSPHGSATSDAPGMDLDVPALAVVDEPELQRLSRWQWQPRTPLLIVATSHSGASTAAASAVACALSADPNLSVHLCGLEPTAVSSCEGPAPAARRGTVAAPTHDVRTTDAVAYGAPAARSWNGTVVGGEDPRRLGRLWELAAGGELAGSLLVIDDAEQMTQAVDLARGAGAGTALLEALCRTAPATGTGLVIACRPQSVSRPWAQALTTRIVLGACEAGVAAVAGLPRGQVCGSGPGRGILVTPEGHHACQVCLPELSYPPRARAPQRAQREDSLRAPGCDRPGGHVLTPLPRRLHTTAGGNPVWAVGGDRAGALEVPGGCVLVVGPPRSGRSTALRSLARALAASGRNEPVMADDLDRCDAAQQEAVEQALLAGRQVLASCTTQAAAGTYRGCLATLRERADLLILWPMVGPAQQVSPVSLLPGLDPAAMTVPGRGALVREGEVLPIQVAPCEQDDMLST